MELIAVGRIVRPQGREGEVRLEPLTDEPSRLQSLTQGYLVPPEAGEPCRVEAVRFQGGVPVLKLRGVDSIADAEALVGRLVSIPRAEARSLPPGRFYRFDLVGCTVQAHDGTRLGVIGDVLGGVAHDFWVLRAGQRECLIPAVSEIVERVDLADRVVVIRPPEGLLDLGD